MSLSKNISYENPEQPPGRTATRRASAGFPSCSSRSATLAAAESVRLIVSLPVVVLTATSLPDGQIYPARIPIHQGGEVLDGDVLAGHAEVPQLLDHPLDDAPMDVAHHLGEGRGQLRE